MFERLSVSAMQPHPRNYRRHPPAQLKALGASLARFGQRKPVRVWRDGDGVVRLLAGHGVWEAAKSIGWSEVDVWWFEGSSADAEHLLVADNEVARLGDVDREQLAALLEELRQDDGLEVSGWTSSELDALLADLAAGPLPGDGDDAPPVERLVHSQPGAVYQLGPHRLVCGDSTDAAVWEALMAGDEDGARFDLIWTDPPYGVAYVGGTSEALTLRNDNLDEPRLEMLLRGALGHAFGRLRDGGSAYVASPAGALFRVFGRVLEHRWTADMQWIKDSLVLGRSDFHYAHEAIFYCGPTPTPAQTEFRVPKPRRNADHPTMKPLELITACLTQRAQPGALVCDPFGGSGSTLIAAAMERMVCRTIELDPRYADVIRRRWTKWALANGIEPGDGALESE